MGTQNVIAGDEALRKSEENTDVDTKFSSGKGMTQTGTNKTKGDADNVKEKFENTKGGTEHTKRGGQKNKGGADQPKEKFEKTKSSDADKTKSNIENTKSEMGKTKKDPDNTKTGTVKTKSSDDNGKVCTYMTKKGIQKKNSGTCATQDTDTTKIDKELTAGTIEMKEGEMKENSQNIYITTTVSSKRPDTAEAQTQTEEMGPVGQDTHSVFTRPKEASADDYLTLDIEAEAEKIMKIVDNIRKSRQQEHKAKLNYSQQHVPQVSTCVPDQVISPSDNSEATDNQLQCLASSQQDLRISPQQFRIPQAQIPDTHVAASPIQISVEQIQSKSKDESLVEQSEIGSKNFLLHRKLEGGDDCSLLSPTKLRKGWYTRYMKETSSSEEKDQERLLRKRNRSSVSSEQTYGETSKVSFSQSPKKKTRGLEEIFEATPLEQNFDCLQDYEMLIASTNSGIPTEVDVVTKYQMTIDYAHVRSYSQPLQKEGPVIQFSDHVPCTTLNMNEFQSQYNVNQTDIQGGNASYSELVRGAGNSSTKSKSNAMDSEVTMQQQKSPEKFRSCDMEMEIAQGNQMDAVRYSDHSYLTQSIDDKSLTSESAKQPVIQVKYEEDALNYSQNFLEVPRRPLGIGEKDLNVVESAVTSTAISNISQYIPFYTPNPNLGQNTIIFSDTNYIPRVSLLPFSESSFENYNTLTTDRNLRIPVTLPVSRSPPSTHPNVLILFENWKVDQKIFLNDKFSIMKYVLNFMDAHLITTSLFQLLSNQKLVEATLMHVGEFQVNLGMYSQKWKPLVSESSEKNILVYIGRTKESEKGENKDRNENMQRILLLSEEPSSIEKLETLRFQMECHIPLSPTTMTTRVLNNCIPGTLRNSMMNNWKTNYTLDNDMVTAREPFVILEQLSEIDSPEVSGRECIEYIAVLSGTDTKSLKKLLALKTDCTTVFEHLTQIMPSSSFSSGVVSKYGLYENVSSTKANENAGEVDTVHLADYVVPTNKTRENLSEALLLLDLGAERLFDSSNVPTNKSELCSKQDRIELLNEEHNSQFEEERSRVVEFAKTVQNSPNKSTSRTSPEIMRIYGEFSDSFELDHSAIGSASATSMLSNSSSSFATEEDPSDNYSEQENVFPGPLTADNNGNPDCELWQLDIIVPQLEQETSEALTYTSVPLRGSREYVPSGRRLVFNMGNLYQDKGESVREAEDTAKVFEESIKNTARETTEESCEIVEFARYDFEKHIINLEKLLSSEEPGIEESGREVEEGAEYVEGRIFDIEDPARHIEESVEYVEELIKGGAVRYIDGSVRYGNQEQIRNETTRDETVRDAESSLLDTGETFHSVGEAPLYNDSLLDVTEVLKNVAERLKYMSEPPSATGESVPMTAQKLMTDKTLNLPLTIFCTRDSPQRYSMPLLVDLPYQHQNIRMQHRDNPNLVYSPSDMCIQLNHVKINEVSTRIQPRQCTAFVNPRFPANRDGSRQQPLNAQNVNVQSQQVHSRQPFLSPLNSNSLNNQFLRMYVQPLQMRSPFPAYINLNTPQSVGHQNISKNIFGQAGSSTNKIYSYSRPNQSYNVQSTGSSHIQSFNPSRQSDVPFNQTDVPSSQIVSSCEGDVPSSQQYVQSSQTYVRSGQQYAPSSQGYVQSRQHYGPSSSQAGYVQSSQSYVPHSQHYVSSSQGGYVQSSKHFVPSSPRSYVQSSQYYAPTSEGYVPSTSITSTLNYVPPPSHGYDSTTPIVSQNYAVHSQAHDLRRQGPTSSSMGRSSSNPTELLSNYQSFFGSHAHQAEPSAFPKRLDSIPSISATHLVGSRTGSSSSDDYPSGPTIKNFHTYKADSTNKSLNVADNISAAQITDTVYPAIRISSSAILPVTTKSQVDGSLSVRSDSYGGDDYAHSERESTLPDKETPPRDDSCSVKKKTRRRKGKGKQREKSEFGDNSQREDTYNVQHRDNVGNSGNTPQTEVYAENAGCMMPQSHFGLVSPSREEVAEAVEGAIIQHFMPSSSTNVPESQAWYES